MKAFLFSLTATLSSAMALANTIVLEPGNSVTIKPGVETVVSCNKMQNSELSYNVLITQGASIYYLTGSGSDCRVAKKYDFFFTHDGTRAKILKEIKCDSELYYYIRLEDSLRDYFVNAKDVFKL